MLISVKVLTTNPSGVLWVKPIVNQKYSLCRWTPNWTLWFKKDVRIVRVTAFFCCWSQ